MDVQILAGVVDAPEKYFQAVLLTALAGYEESRGGLVFEVALASWNRGAQTTMV